MKNERNEMKTLAEAEKEHIQKVLQAVNGNRTHAAKILGISAYTLARRCKKHDLPAGKPGRPAFEYAPPE